MFGGVSIDAWQNNPFGGLRTPENVDNEFYTTALKSDS